MSMAERLLAARLDSGMSLVLVSRRSGVTDSYISQVERGLKVPSLPALLKIADALGVSLASLFR